MVTIAHLVEKRIEERPFLQEALRREIINYGALAEELLPEIQKELKKRVKLAAVMMALRRLAEKIESRFEKKLKLDKDLDLTIKSNLASLTVVKNLETINSIKKIYKLVDLGEDMLTVTQGNKEITIIAHKKYLPKIKEIFEENKKDIKSMETNLASLSIYIPKAATDIPGFYFLILRALAWDNINIVEAVSTFTELTLIMYEEDVTRGYNCLRKLMVKE